MVKIKPWSVPSTQHSFWVLNSSWASWALRFFQRCPRRPDPQAGRQNDPWNRAKWHLTSTCKHAFWRLKTKAVSRYCANWWLKDYHAGRANFGHGYYYTTPFLGNGKALQTEPNHYSNNPLYGWGRHLRRPYLYYGWGYSLMLWIFIVPQKQVWSWLQSYNGKKIKRLSPGCTIHCEAYSWSCKIIRGIDWDFLSATTSCLV